METRRKRRASSPAPTRRPAAASGNGHTKRLQLRSSVAFFRHATEALWWSVVLSLFAISVEPVYMAAASAWAARGWSDATFFTAGTSLVHAVLYLGVNSFFLYCDRTGYLEEYKLHRTAAMGPTDELLRRTWRDAAVGQFVIGPPLIFAVSFVFKLCGMPPTTAPLPALPSLIGHFLLAYLVNIWGFYSTHRLLHTKFLYAKVHKRHHEYKGTVGFAAEYAHPFEQLLSNYLPTVGGCLLSGSHACIWFVWLGQRLLATYESHSGYCFRGSWLDKLGLSHAAHAAHHDFHHTVNSGNFGAEDVDHWFGTQEAWLRVGGVDGYLKLRRAANGNALRRRG